MIDSRKTPTWLVLLGATAWMACGGDSTSGPAGGSGGNGGGLLAGGTGGSAGSTSAVETGGTTAAASGGTTSAAGGGTTSAASGGTTSAASGGKGGAASGGTGGSTATGGAAGGTGGADAGPSPPVIGGPCGVPGEQSACATTDANPCVSCQGHWLYCSNGTWHETHCDPPPPDSAPRLPVDSAPDAPTAIDVTPDEARPAAPETSIDAPAVLRGYLVYASELLAFESCGSPDLAWANLQGWEKGKDLLPALGPYCVTTDAGPAPCPGTIYVELVGTVSSCGGCGHMSKFSQDLRVTEFLAASLTGPADCPFLPPVYPG